MSDISAARRAAAAANLAAASGPTPAPLRTCVCGARGEVACPVCGTVFPPEPPPRVMARPVHPAPTGPTDEPPPPPVIAAVRRAGTLANQLAELRRAAVAEAMRVHYSNRRAAAKALGISLRTLASILRELQSHRANAA